jgi:hypothetical protein
MASRVRVFKCSCGIGWIVHAGFEKLSGLDKLHRCGSHLRAQRAHYSLHREKSAIDGKNLMQHVAKLHKLLEPTVDYPFPPEK